MVQLSPRPLLGRVSAAFALVTGLAAAALGVGLVLESDSAFGRAWSAAFIVFGAVTVLGAVVASRPVGPESPGSRVIGLATLTLLGTWAAVTGIVGAVEESWLWGVLLGAFAVYLFWAAARLWRRGPATRRP
ncbi:hypothetical protein SAMN05192575_101452 [Nocardioides alpinus]|uniref:Integral membrane protein n=1 Tax=Nocardioides alpinus TaxID=748909 RepID=A0A1I0VTM3_9ACTN|nr:hypothetical protein [Nocardioides alpinus]PKH37470.1 hypothetical protein CXG46_18660 [Nocardioides alpinus]SFA79684.1 hypothetical protein SAMN05192575_101452 [Nocardioides alpinus]